MKPDNVLSRILAHKRAELDARRQAMRLELLEDRARAAPMPRGFTAALAATIAAGRPAVIAEIKKASPSKGVIRASFDPAAIATSYAAAGATCLSVLTDEHFFQGHDDYLTTVRESVALPALRKDFTLDVYQVYEARALGADCVLLIAAALDPERLRELHALAHELGMDALVEIHDRAELDVVLRFDPPLIGINNRNLETFETRLEVTYALLDHVPESTLLVTESGIHSAEQVAELRARGVHAYLVGEAFMREDDPGAALERLFDDSSDSS